MNYEAALKEAVEMIDDEILSLNASWEDGFEHIRIKYMRSRFQKILDHIARHEVVKNCPMPRHHPSCDCNGEGGDR